MSARRMTAEEIRIAGIEALNRELGPIGMVRFLQQFETGSGDYSHERHRLFAGADVSTVARSLRKRRGKPAPRRATAACR